MIAGEKELRVFLMRHKVFNLFLIRAEWIRNIFMISARPGRGGIDCRNCLRPRVLSGRYQQGFNGKRSSPIIVSLDSVGAGIDAFRFFEWAGRGFRRIARYKEHKP